MFVLRRVRATEVMLAHASLLSLGFRLCAHPPPAHFHPYAREAACVRLSRHVVTGRLEVRRTESSRVRIEINIGPGICLRRCYANSRM